MNLEFNITLTPDLKHYVVDILIPDPEDDYGGEWFTITKHFNTEAEAREWASHIRSNHKVNGEWQ